MEILLVSANREKNPYPVFPLGLSYLVEPLARRGHRLRVLDLCFAENAEAAVGEALAEFAPQVALISIRNIDNVTYPGSRSYLAGVRELVGWCRGKATVIVGGSGFSLMPVQLLAHLDADYGVVGEGEEVLPELLAALERGGKVSLPGVLARGEASYPPISYLKGIGVPDRSLFPVERYQVEGGMANLQTKRGCPFSCIYCNYPLLNGNQVRLRPVPEIVAEIRSMIDDHGVSYLYFVDDIFNYPVDFAEELCRALVREQVTVSWSAFVNPGFVTPRLVDAMLAAGCDAVEFGSESGSDRMLANLGKSFRADEIRSASRLCREAGIDFAHYMLFGGPGESEASIDESFVLMDEVDPTAIIAMTGIRIFPGTPLYRTALQDGVIAEDSYMLEPVFYIAPQLKETLCEMVADRALARKNWVAPGMELNMSDAMLDALRRFPVRGPMWKHVKRLTRSRIKPM